MPKEKWMEAHKDYMYTLKIQKSHDLYNEPNPFPYFSLSQLSFSINCLTFLYHHPLNYFAILLIISLFFFFLSKRKVVSLLKSSNLLIKTSEALNETHVFVVSEIIRLRYSQGMKNSSLKLTAVAFICICMLSSQEHHKNT